MNPIDKYRDMYRIAKSGIVTTLISTIISGPHILFMIMVHDSALRDKGPKDLSDIEVFTIIIIIIIVCQRK